MLLHAASYLKDNRIPPQGFTRSQAAAIDVQTLPAGIGSDTDFNAGAGAEGSGTDTVHYQVDLATINGPYAVDARLLYQSVQPAFIDSMHSLTQRVTRFKSMAQQQPPTVEVLASNSAVSVDVTPGTSPPPSPPPSTPTTPTSTSGGGGGGCVLDRAMPVDPTLPLLLAAAGLLGRARSRVNWR